MASLFYLGIILVLGAFMEWLSPKLRIPKVVGYLILGLVIGPEFLGIITNEFVEDSHIITELSLSIIALLVGATIKFSELKKHAKEVVYITLFQSFGTFLIVVLGISLVTLTMEFTLQQSLFIAFLLGAIATATDTAAPLAIVQELKSKNEFTSTFLSIIAFDDAISLIFFTLVITFSSTFFTQSSFDWLSVFSSVSIVVLSILVGLVAGFVNILLEKLFYNHKGMETISTLGLIFIVYSLSEYWHLEPLLGSMVMGVVMVNLSKQFDIVEEEIDNHLVEIIFMLFFILSAMHLDISALNSLPLIIVGYIGFRVLGKVMGSYIGASLAKSSDSVKKYMGIALLPQAGVAIGLSLSIQNITTFESIAPMILNVVIATTFVHELIGPFFTRYALLKVK